MTSVAVGANKVTIAGGKVSHASKADPQLEATT